MIICHSRKFIFVHIHKTGGTSIEQALDPHLAWNDLILGGSQLGEKIQAPYAKRYGLNKHSTVSDIESVCGSEILDSYYVFSLVRHPVSRVCSMYNFVATTLHKWATQQNIDPVDVEKHITPESAKKKPALKWASTKAFLRSRNFSEFIRHRDLTNAPGFRPQVSCLSGRDGKTLAAQFFRLEDCPIWVSELTRHLGVEFSLAQSNKSDVKFHQDSSVTPEDRRYLESWFQLDYELLGYPP